MTSTTTASSGADCPSHDSELPWKSPPQPLRSIQ
nr:MAG TPA: hypothetical protein [Caudoviricetes sp.]